MADAACTVISTLSAGFGMSPSQTPGLIKLFRSTPLRMCETDHNYRGVDKFFKTLAKLASSLDFSLAKSENNWSKI
jgi:hypothetical protein